MWTLTLLWNKPLFFTTIHFLGNTCRMWTITHTQTDRLIDLSEWASKQMNDSNYANQKPFTLIKFKWNANAQNFILKILFCLKDFLISWISCGDIHLYTVRTHFLDDQHSYLFIDWLYQTCILTFWATLCWLSLLSLQHFPSLGFSSRNDLIKMLRLESFCKLPLGLLIILLRQKLWCFKLW